MSFRIDAASRILASASKVWHEPSPSFRPSGSVFHFLLQKMHTGGNIPVFELDFGEVISERLTILGPGLELAGCVTSCEHIAEKLL